MNDKDMAVKDELGETKANPMVAGEASPKKKKRRWQDLTRKQKKRSIVRGVLQFCLMLWSLWDIRHRTADQIKGSKRLWTALAFAQPVGPIAYLLFGRKKKAARY